jgi:Adenomatous polyposis coli (APC) repeat
LNIDKLYLVFKSYFEMSCTRCTSWKNILHECGIFTGCLKLLIQLLHDNGSADPSAGHLGTGRGCRAARARAAKALRNIVCANPDSQRSRREERVLRLLEQIRAHCDEVRGDSPLNGESSGQEGIPSRHGEQYGDLMCSGLLVKYP